MKILLCSPYKGVNPNNPGGIAIWARNIMNYYASSKDNNEIVLCKIDRKHDFENTFSFARIWYGLKEYFTNYKLVKDALKRERFDMMHVCTSASLSLIKDLLFLKAAHSHAVNTTIHFHFGRIPEIFNARNWEYKLICKVIKKATVAVVMDKKSYDTLKAQGFTNIEYLPNPLSPAVINEIKDIQETRPTRFQGRALFAGHVIPSKGVYELVEACAKVAEVKELYILGFIEDPKVKEDLINISDSIRGNHDWIKFEGAVPHKRVIAEMMSSSLFVLPTYTEGFPNVILECMASECPIITTPVGAIPEMLNINSDAPCGFCTEVKDIDELKKQIEWMFNNPEEVGTITARAKKRVFETYSISSVWEKLIGIWANS